VVGRRAVGGPDDRRSWRSEIGGSSNGIYNWKRSSCWTGNTGASVFSKAPVGRGAHVGKEESRQSGVLLDGGTRVFESISLRQPTVCLTSTAFPGHTGREKKSGICRECEGLARDQRKRDVLARCRVALDAFLTGIAGSPPLPGNQSWQPNEGRAQDLGCGSTLLAESLLQATHGSCDVRSIRSGQSSSVLRPRS